MYSLGFFAALCHIAGPVGDFGNVGYVAKRITDLFIFEGLDKQSEEDDTEPGSS